MLGFRMMLTWSARRHYIAPDVDKGDVILDVLEDVHRKLDFGEALGLISSKLKAFIRFLVLKLSTDG